MQAPERRPPVGVVFDSSAEDSIDQVLALTMLLVYDSRREARLSSLSISRNNLRTAAFCDLVSRFFGASVPIGMFENGPSGTSVPPMLSAPLDRVTPEGRPLFSRRVEKLNDTADPVALIRNALTAQQDQNAVVILTGPPVNLLGMLALPGTRQLVEKKARSLVIAAPFKDAPGFTKLLKEWPGTVVFAGEEFNTSLLFPGESIEQDFSWATNHPVVDAYRSVKTMPYDAPSSAMAAVLYAVHPDKGFFKVSDPGTMTILADGRGRFSPGSQGKHRQLTAELEQKEKIVQAYRQIVSTKPPEPRQGARGPQP
jgi:hypothetical protein